MDNLYSRQIGALGKDAMNKLSKIKIALLGCDTIGTEMAKSLSLMGLHTIYLMDTTKYKKTIHYGRLVYKPTAKQTLAEAAQTYITTLNSNICVNIIYTLPQLYSLIRTAKINSVVITDEKYPILDIEQKCIASNIPCILGINTHCMGMVFSNFGQWDIFDTSSSVKQSGYILSHNLQGNTYTLCKSSKTIPNSKHFCLSDGTHAYDYTALNYKLTHDKHMNTTTLLIRVKQTAELDTILTAQNILFTECDNPQHIQHQSLLEVMSSKKYTYITSNSSYTLNDTLFTHYIKYITSPKHIHFMEKKHLLHTRFYILGTIIGGIIAQEVVKLTGKYTPLDQCILFNYSNLIETTDMYKGNYALYDLGCLFSKTTIKKIKTLNAFMVGCGALGCEISKNMAVMGFSQARKSSLTITDMDTIELSNLSRQFLFQPEDINSYKSETIKAKLGTYCPRMNITSLTKQVCAEHDHEFDFKFWKKMDIVINALDNVKARRYVDSKCVLLDTPLFESGTLGTKGNVQAIIPYKTATYSEIEDSPEEGIPMCTVRNFPNNLNHCIEWSLGMFDTLFNCTILDIHLYLVDTPALIKSIHELENESLRAERYQNLYYMLRALTSNQLDSLYTLGVYMYNHYIQEPITEILHTHPADSLHDDQPFWSGNKLKPVHVPPSTILTLEFYNHLASILQAIKCDVNFPPICKSDIVCTHAKTSISDICDYIHSTSNCNEYANVHTHERCSPLTYDKDNDAHLNIMTDITNTRAMSYTIAPGSHLDIKLASGKVIPALSTTTSIISGFVVLDILKYIKGIPKYTEININIANNIYNIYSAFKPQITYNNMFHRDYNLNVKTYNDYFSTWDKIIISQKEDMVLTSNELYVFLEQNYKIRASVIFSGNLVLPQDPMKNKNLTTIRHQTLDKCLLLEAMSFDTDNIPILIPPILVFA